MGDGAGDLDRRVLELAQLTEEFTVSRDTTQQADTGLMHVTVKGKAFASSAQGNASTLTTVNTGSVGAGDSQQANVVPQRAEVKKRNPYEFAPPEKANSVIEASKDPEKRREQLEALFEVIELFQRNKFARGLVFSSDVDSSSKRQKVAKKDLPGVEKVLGSGSFAGEVLLMRDVETGKKFARKTVLISQFHRDEIEIWMDMAGEGRAPEVYSVKLEGNEVIIHMEAMAGKELLKLIYEGTLLKDHETARGVALCVVHDLIETFQSMQSKQCTHGDMHPGNVMLLPSLDIKLFDYGLARKLLLDVQKDSQRLKNDIVGIIQIFCGVYSGYYNEEGAMEMKKWLQVKDFTELSDFLGKMPEWQRREMYSIMSELFDSVRDVHQEGFGNVQCIKDHVKSLLPKDIKEFKKKLAALLFPEMFKYKVEFDANTYEMEGEVEDDGTSHPIWDDPDLMEYADNVTDEDLLQLGVNLLK